MNNALIIVAIALADDDVDGAVLILLVGARD